MKLGIFAKTFAGETPDIVLAAAREAGYEAVQYNMSCSGLGSLPIEISCKATETITIAVAKTGIDIAAVSATYNMVHPDPTKRNAGRASFSIIAGQARRIGTRLLTVCTGSRDPDDKWRHHPSNQSPETWRDMVLEFEMLIAIAEESDIDICVEPELGNVVNSASRARDLIDTLQSDRIRIVFDPANLVAVASPEDRRAIVEGSVDLLADRIALAHAKDRLGNGDYAAPGNGVIDFSHYVEVLRSSGFSGALIAHGFEDLEAPAAAIFLGSTIQNSKAMQ